MVFGQQPLQHKAKTLFLAKTAACALSAGGTASIASTSKATRGSLRNGRMASGRLLLLQQACFCFVFYRCLANKVVLALFFKAFCLLWGLAIVYCEAYSLLSVRSSLILRLGRGFDLGCRKILQGAHILTLVRESGAVTTIIHKTCSNLHMSHAEIWS